MTIGESRPGSAIPRSKPSGLSSARELCGVGRSKRVAVALRIYERLEDHDTAAFGTHVPVGTGIKAPASAAARDHRGAAEADERFWLQQQIDGADHCYRAFARPEAETPLVKR